MINKDVQGSKTSIFWYELLNVGSHMTQQQPDAVAQGHEGCGEILKIGDQVKNDRFQVVSHTNVQKNHDPEPGSEIRCNC